MIEQTAAMIGRLVAQKQKAYGDSFGKCGKFLELLYPNGINKDQYGDMLAIVRVFDKLMRIATDKKAFDENPWKDICGYSLLALRKENNEKTD